MHRLLRQRHTQDPCKWKDLHYAPTTHSHLPDSNCLHRPPSCKPLRRRRLLRDSAPPRLGHRRPEVARRFAGRTATQSSRSSLQTGWPSVTPSGPNSPITHRSTTRPRLNRNTPVTIRAGPDSIGGQGSRATTWNSPSTPISAKSNSTQSPTAAATVPLRPGSHPHLRGRTILPAKLHSPHCQAPTETQRNRPPLSAM